MMVVRLVAVPRAEDPPVAGPLVAGHPARPAASRGSFGASKR